MNKLGIFAGTFDPVHLGHSAFLEQSIAEHSLDKVLVLVEKEPRFKTCLESYVHRKKMAELVFENNPKAAVYESSSDSFPITSSLPVIRAEYPDAQLYLLVGEDVARHIGTWENADELLRDVKLIVGKRDNQAPYGKASSVKVRKSLKIQSVSSDLDSKIQNYITQNNLY